MKAAATTFKPPLTISSDKNIFTQFVIDPCSYNLPPECRTNLNNAEECDTIFKYTRDYIFSIVRLCAKKIEKLKEEQV